MGVDSRYRDIKVIRRADVTSTEWRQRLVKPSEAFRTLFFIWKWGEVTFLDLVVE